MNRAISTARRTVRELDVPPLIYLLAGGIAVLAVLGAYNALVSEIFAFSLQEELRNGFNAPVLFSGVLLLIASALAARLAVDTPARLWPWAGLAALFAFMAFDESLLIHEDLQRAAGLEWQILYLPLFVLAVALWLTVLRACSTAGERLLWVAGAAAWGLVQVLEAIGHLRDGREPTEVAAGGGALRGVEELLEMIGTALFVWVLLLISSRRVRVRAAQAGGRNPDSLPSAADPR